MRSIYQIPWKMKNRVDNIINNGRKLIILPCKIIVLVDFDIFNRYLSRAEVFSN